MKESNKNRSKRIDESSVNTVKEVSMDMNALSDIKAPECLCTIRYMYGIIIFFAVMILMNAI